MPVRGAVAAAVEGEVRIDDVACDAGGHLAGIAGADVVHHVLVNPAQGIGGRIAVSAAGEGGAQDHLAGGTLAPADHGHEWVGLAFGGVLEINLHAGGDDAARVMADAHYGPQQGRFLFLTGAAGVHAEAYRQAVDFQEFRQVAYGIVLEQVRPGQHHREAGAVQVARARAVDVCHPAEGAQCVAGRRVGAQAQLVAVVRVGLEQALFAVVDGGDGVQAVAEGPLQFQSAEGLQNAIGHIEQGVFEPGGGAQLLLDQLGVGLLGGAGSCRRFDGPGDVQDGPAALAQLAGEVGVLVLHIAGQVGDGGQVALFCLAQQAGQACGRQPFAGVFRVAVQDGADPAVLVRLQVFQVQLERPAVDVEDLRLSHGGSYQPPRDRPA
ncbi:hypothetical protein D9M71_202170 [compost metagenome]